MNNTLSNGLLVLEHLATQARTFSLSTLARDLDLPKSHVHRLLQTLLQAAYVEQDHRRHYRLGLGALRLIRNVLPDIPVRHCGYHLANRLAQSVQMACHIAVPYAEHALSVAYLSPTGRSPAAVAALGHLLYAQSSASGKLLLAYRDPDEINLILEHLDYGDLPAAASSAAVPAPMLHDADSLRQELVHIRQRHYAVSNQENGAALISMAVPIRDPQSIVCASLSVSALTEEFPVHKQAYIFNELRSCAKRIEAALLNKKQ